MSEDSSVRVLRHILVAADGSPHSQAALRAAVRLAASVEAEVDGLFVEDEQLLRAAALPFAAEVRTHSQSPAPLTDRRIERQLRRQAERARTTLQRAAEQWDVPHSFRVLQGDVSRELLSAASEADLLALGKTSTDSSRQRLGSTARTVLSESDRSVLVLRSPVDLQSQVLTYFDGSPASERALGLAVRLARRGDPGQLRVFLPGATADALREAVQARCEGLRAALTVHALPPIGPDWLTVLPHQPRGGVVVLPHECPLLSSTSLQRFLYEVDRPLLLVR